MRSNSQYEEEYSPRPLRLNGPLFLANARGSKKKSKKERSKKKKSKKLRR